MSTAMVAMLWAAAHPEMPGMQMLEVEHFVAHSMTGRATALGLASYPAVAALWWLRAGLRLVPLVGGRPAVTRPAGMVPPAPAPGLTPAPAQAPTQAFGGGAGRPASRVFGPVGQAGCQMLMAAAMCLALLTPM
jgi:hypothetical protein